VMVVLALSNNCSTQVVSLSVRLSGVLEVLVLWKWTVLLLRYVQQYRVVENLTSFPWYSPVPLRGSRLSIYSFSRNLAVRTSLVTRLLLSKYHHGCVGPALQRMQTRIIAHFLWLQSGR